MKAKGGIIQLLGYSLLIIFSPIILPFALFLTLISLLLKSGDRKAHLKTLSGEIFGLFVLGLIYLFIASPTEITGTAMEPTLWNGEYSVNNKMVYEINNPQRGDIVVFASPRNKDVDYISRIIAISGDTVQIKEGAVYLNSTLLQEPYIKGITLPSAEEAGIKEGEVFTVPEDSFFVMSDNRLHSSDSRNFGAVPKSNLIGNVSFRYWPFERFGLIASYKNTSTALTGDDLYSIGLYFLKQKNITKAEEYFIKAGNEYKNVSALNELGNMYSQRKDYTLAIQTYQKALEVEPENPIVLQNIGSTHWTMEDKDNATVYLKKSLAAYERGDVKADESFLNFLKEIGIIN